MKPSVQAVLFRPLHGAQAGAVSEVGDDRAALSRLRVDPRKDRGNVLVGKAVEAVAPDALLGVFPGQGEGLAYGRDARVKGGVEAGHLRQIRVSLSKGADGGQVVGLMKRRQGHELFQVFQDVIVDDGGFCVLEAAVNDAVPHGHNPVGAVEHPAAPGKEGIDGPFMIERGTPGPRFLLYDLPRPVFCLETGFREDALDLPVIKDLGILSPIRIDGELEARRPRIENDDEIRHDRHLTCRSCSFKGRFAAADVARECFTVHLPCSGTS